VEWTIDEPVVWGRNMRPADETAPAVEQGGHCVIVRGRLDVTADAAAVLDLAGDQILLDTAGPIPSEAAGAWVNLYLQRENVAFYPYDL
jgi:hypothetical protein